MSQSAYFFGPPGRYRWNSMLMSKLHARARVIHTTVICNTVATYSVWKNIRDFQSVRQNKIFQREKRDIYIMQEHFYTKLSIFIYHICLHKSV